MLTIPNNPFDFNRKGNSTRFPSVDSAFSFKSRNSKLLLTLDQSDQSSTNSLIKTFNSPISLSKKKVRISLALNHENEYMIPGNGFSSFKGMYTSNLKEKIEERRSLQIKKHLNIKLEEIKRKSKKSVFSTDNYSDSKTLGDKFSKIPSYILDNKLKIVHAAQMKEPLIVLEYLFQNMATAIQLENLNFLCETINLIGKFYLIAHDIKNAIYSFYNLSILADMINKRELKIDCYISLSNCCKKMRLYEQSVRFLKKALQYAWHFKQDSKELLIYDELGLINFLTGDLIKAKYYHERFVNNQTEENNTPCKSASEAILLKILGYSHFEGFGTNGSMNNSPQMTSLILTRLGLNKVWNNETNSPVFKRKDIEENSPLHTFFYQRSGREDNIPTVKFFTNLEAVSQIESIMSSKEFQFDTSSPRSTIPRNLLKKLDKYEFPKKKPKVVIIDDPMRKNIPLEDKIRFRNKLEYISFDLDTQLKKMRILAKNEKLEKRHFCLYNHLTPNRNLMGYDYHFSHFTNLEQISHYYDKIYAYDFSLNNIHINEN